MTNAEIIKALECCSRSATVKACEGCPCKNTDNCINLNCINLEKFTLDLINRQNAEIERLQELLKGWKTEAYKVAEEKDKLYCEAVERVKTTKSEAIKEFAERLKNYYIKNRIYDRPDAHTKIAFLFSTINNLVKEMAGDTE